MCLIIFMVTLIGYTEGQPLYNDIGNDLSVDTTQACYKECYDRDVQLQTQVTSLENQLNSLRVTCPLECVRKNDPKGKKYFGTINVTKTGIPCQRWDSQTPHKHKFDELADHENYCRNPDEDNGPWCYTTNDTQRYDFCPVPHC